MFNLTICNYQKYRLFLLILFITFLFFLPRYSVGNTNSAKEATAVVRFTDPFEFAYADFQLVFFNETQVIEITLLRFDAKYTDVIEVRISELTLTIEKFNQSMGKLGEDEKTLKIDIKFNQTSQSKNFTWGKLDYPKIYFLKIDFRISGTIKYEGIFSTPLLYYTESVEAEAIIEDILFEVTPSRGMISFDFYIILISLITICYIIRNRKRRDK